MDDPLLSVALITYRHQKYIEQAVEGSLMQEGIEDFEIVVGDDKSLDDTVSIIRNTLKDHPNVRFLQRKKNVGMHRNWLDTIMACKGKYIALIEGDDLWTDSRKLKKQIDILEKNPDLSLCFTDAAVINEMDDGQEYGTYLSHQDVDIDKRIFTSEDLSRQNFISTVSVVMRNQTHWPVNRHYYSSPYVDWIILMLKAIQGDMAFIPDVTCAYRVHPTGAFGFSEFEHRRVNHTKCLRNLFFILPQGKEKKWVLENYLLSIEEFAQHLKSRQGGRTPKFIFLKSIRKLAEIAARPLFTDLIRP